MGEHIYTIHKEITILQQLDKLLTAISWTRPSIVDISAAVSSPPAALARKYYRLYYFIQSNKSD